VHRFSDAIGYEPCGFTGYLYHLVQLVNTDVLLDGRNQVRGLQPLVQWDMGGIEYGLNLYRELPLALQAAPQTGARRVAGHTSNATLIGIPALGASWAIRPNDFFQPLKRSYFVMEMRLRQKVHGQSTD